MVVVSYSNEILFTFLFIVYLKRSLTLSISENKFYENEDGSYVENIQRCLLVTINSETVFNKFLMTNLLSYFYLLMYIVNCIFSNVTFFFYSA